MDSLLHGPDFKRSLSVAYAALSRRAYSVHELRENLEKKKVPESLREKVLKHLIGQGLLNDREYAERFVSERHRRGQGKRRIKFELIRRGVSENIIAGALETLADESEEKKALELALKKHKQGKSYNQVMRFLIGRGFTPDVCRKVLAGVFVTEDE